MDEVHWKLGNQGFRCQAFFHIQICQTSNLDKGKGRGHESAVTSARV
jgi:hypothetical protein